MKKEFAKKILPQIEVNQRFHFHADTSTTQSFETLLITRCTSQMRFKEDLMTNLPLGLLQPHITSKPCLVFSSWQLPWHKTLLHFNTNSLTQSFTFSGKKYKSQYTNYSKWMKLKIHCNTITAVAISQMFW